MKRILLLLAVVLLFAAEFATVYFIMPFPGSQENDSLPFAYWLHHNISWIRALLLVAIIWLLLPRLRSGSRGGKIVWAVIALLYGALFYMVHFQMKADKMFYQPGTVLLQPAASNAVDTNKLVIGVVVNGEARAYPIQMIGYHHQVRDSIGNTPIMVTYCTVCRTGRVFSPIVNGRTENFRLVGMDHFNAMFEDETTKSWWQQATGLAVAGPLKGIQLTEIPSSQVQLDAWLRQYPQSLVLQGDSNFSDKYTRMDSYDKGSGQSDLTRRDSSSWKNKSWVLGIDHAGINKAYDWNELVTRRCINDSAGDKAWLVMVEKDSSSFHAYDRRVDSLRLVMVPEEDGLRDQQTGSSWNTDGLAIDGPLKGKQLQRLPAYQEFWHSWRHFHPGTVPYGESR